MKWPLFVSQLCNVSVVSSSNDIVMIYQFMLAVFSNKFFITYSRYVNYLFKGLPYKPIIHFKNASVVVFQLYFCSLQDSMTSLLTHTVAHSTRLSFRPKTNNQSIKKFLSLVVNWVKVVKNCQILTFKVNFLHQELSESF